MVGRLICNKHQYEIIKSLIKLKNIGFNFVVLIVGYGPDKDAIIKLIEKDNCKDVIRFIGRVSHNDVLSYFNISDISINLSEGGALGNVSLEALSSSNCLITLGVDKERHINESISNFIPDNAYFRVDRNNIGKDIEILMSEILSDREKLNQIKSNGIRFFKSKILTWEQRIDIDISTLKNVAHLKSNG